MASAQCTRSASTAYSWITYRRSSWPTRVWVWPTRQIFGSRSPRSTMYERSSARRVSSSASPTIRDGALEARPPRSRKERMELRDLRLRVGARVHGGARLRPGGRSMDEAPRHPDTVRSGQRKTSRVPSRLPRQAAIGKAGVTRDQGRAPATGVEAEVRCGSRLVCCPGHELRRRHKGPSRQVTLLLLLAYFLRK